jgi:hypothetical protein
LWGIFGCRGENSEKVFHVDIRRGLALLVKKNLRKSARKERKTFHADIRRLETQIYANEDQR